MVDCNREIKQPDCIRSPAYRIIVDLPDIKISNSFGELSSLSLIVIVLVFKIVLSCAKSTSPMLLNNNMCL